MRLIHQGRAVRRSVCGSRPGRRLHRGPKDPKGFPGEGPPLPVSLVLPLKNPPMCAQNHRRSKRGSISNRVFFRMGMWFYLPRSLLLLKGPPVPESRRSARFFAAGSLLPPVCAKRPLFHSQGHHKCLLCRKEQPRETASLSSSWILRRRAPIFTGRPPLP